MNDLGNVNSSDNYARQLLEINVGIGLINKMPGAFCFDSSLKLQKTCSQEKEIERKDPRDVIKTIEFLSQEILQTDPSKISKAQWIKIFDNAEEYISNHPICDKDRFIQSTVEPIFNSTYLKSDGHCVIEILRKDPKNISSEELMFLKQFVSCRNVEHNTIRFFSILHNILNLEFLIIESFRKQCPKFIRDPDNYDLSSKRIVPAYKILWKDISLESPESVSLAMMIQKSTSIKINALFAPYAPYEKTLNEETKHVLHIYRLCLLLNVVHDFLYMTNEMYLRWVKEMKTHQQFSKEYESLFLFSIDQYYKKDGQPRENALQHFKEQLQNSQFVLDRYNKKKQYIDGIQNQVDEKITEVTRLQSGSTPTKIGASSEYAVSQPNDLPMIEICDPDAIECFFNEELFNKIDAISQVTDLSELHSMINKYFMKKNTELSNKSTDIDLENSAALNPENLKKSLMDMSQQLLPVAKSMFDSYTQSALNKKNEKEGLLSKEDKIFIQNYESAKELLVSKNQIDIDLLYKRMKRLHECEESPFYSSFHLFYQAYINMKKAIDILGSTTNEEDLLCNNFTSQLSLHTNYPKPKTQVKRKQRSRTRPHFKKDESLGNEKKTEKPVISQIQNSNKNDLQIPLHQLLSSKEIIFDKRISNWFEKGTPALEQDSYRELSSFEQKEQKLFHRYPLEITKISLMKGTQSLWKDEDPHYSIVGQIERYKPGKEVTYQGVFTDCFDGRDRKRLYHHHFIRRSFSKSLEDSFNKLIFQPSEELERAQNITVSEETQNVPKKKLRPVIQQRPGVVIVDDKVKQIRYTLLISSYEK